MLKSIQGELGQGNEDVSLFLVLANITVQFTLSAMVYFLALLSSPHFPKGPSVYKGTYAPSVVAILFLAYFLTYGSSSFVEEEHQYWYFFVTSTMGLIFFDFKRNIRGWVTEHFFSCSFLGLELGFLSFFSPSSSVDGGDMRA